MRRPSLRENRFDLTLRCTIYVVFSFTVIAGAKQGSWPPCTATQTPPAASSVLQQQQEPARLDVLARPTGCALAFTTHPGRPTSEHGAAPTALVVSGASIQYTEVAVLRNNVHPCMRVVKRRTGRSARHPFHVLCGLTRGCI